MYSTVIALIPSELKYFFIIASLLDGVRLSVWVTVFRFGIFIVEIPARFGKCTEGMGLQVWCVGAL